MKTLTKYLTTEFLKHLIPVEIFFITIFLLSDFFWRMRSFIEYQAKLIPIIYYLTLNIPLWIVQTLPLSVMLSTLFVVTNFAYTKESIVIQTLGVSIKKFFSVLFLIGIVLSITSFLLHDKVATKCFNKANNFFYTKIKQEETDANLLNMLSYTSYTNDIVYVFIEKYHNQSNKIYGFLSLQFKPNGTLYQIYSAEGNKTGLTLKLKNCTVRKFLQSTLVDEKSYDEFNYKLPIDIQEFRYDYSTEILDRWNIKELKRIAKIMIYKGEPAYRVITEISLRYALSFLNFIVILISVSLGQNVTSWYGKLTSFVYTIIALIIYWTILSFCRTLGELNIINPVISVWIPNILFLVAGILLYLKK